MLSFLMPTCGTALELAVRDLAIDDGKLSVLRASSSKLDKVGLPVAKLNALLSLPTRVSSSAPSYSGLPMMGRGPVLLDRGDARAGDKRFDLGEILGVGTLGPSSVGCVASCGLECGLIIEEPKEALAGDSSNR